MNFEHILAKIAKLLDQNQIPYMVIGGQAVLLYGEPRLTRDIDVTLGIDSVRADDLKQICQVAGLIKVKSFDDSLIEKTNVFPCIDTETGIAVDFIFSFIDYERQAIKRAKKVKVADYAVKFSSPEDIIIHKLFAGRPKDIEDAENILIKQGRKIDMDYIKKQLKVFSTAYPEMPERFKNLHRK
jgi:predicted nucleotidyltransferase